jgi:ketosteroid isomerase-like protein
MQLDGIRVSVIGSRLTIVWLKEESGGWVCFVHSRHLFQVCRYSP